MQLIENVIDEEKSVLEGKLKKHIGEIEVLRELSSALTECETELLNSRRSAVEMVRQEFELARAALQSKEAAVLEELEVFTATY